MIFRTGTLAYQTIVENKATDLDGSLAAAGRLNQQRAHHRALLVANGFDLAELVTARSAVKRHGDAVGCFAFVTEDVLAGFERKVADLHRDLDDKEVGILSLGRIAGGDHHHARYEFALS